MVFLADTMGQPVKDSVWIQTKESCKVYNPRPKKNETITWTGECLDGYANGTGTLTWYSGGKASQHYVGEMKRGIPNGTGRYDYGNGSVYEGLYVNGKLEGRGQIFESDKNGSVYYTYDGEFRADSPDGYGEEIYFYSNGDTSSIYKGSFSDAERDGPGLLKEFSAYRTILIKGIFARNILQGDVEIWEYKNDKLLIYYKGAFQDHARNGHGVEVWGVNEYVGSWANNEKNGKGSLSFAGQIVYEGEWMNDQFNGVGKRTFLDGSHYFGEFKNNQRHGLGVQYWKDGTQYIGEFRKDLLSGSGYIVRGNQVLFSGIWENGSLKSPQDRANVVKRLNDKYKNEPQLSGILQD